MDTAHTVVHIIKNSYGNKLAESAAWRYSCDYCDTGMMWDEWTYRSYLHISCFNLSFDRTVK
jgi:hypothetical protein